MKILFFQNVGYKIFSIFLSFSVVFCATPKPVPQLQPSQLRVSSRQLVLPQGERVALYLQTATQQGLVWLPQDKAAFLEEMQRRVGSAQQLSTADAEGRAGNWGGVQFALESSYRIYRRYEFDIEIPGFCGGELKIFFLNEKHFQKVWVVPEEQVANNFAEQQSCRSNLTPRISLKTLQRAAELARNSKSSPYSYRLLENTVEVSFPGEIP